MSLTDIINSGKKIELQATNEDDARIEALRHFGEEDFALVEVEQGKFVACQPDFTLSDKIECQRVKNSKQWR
ncbi:hypothetical protein [Ochrobactrum sp. BTU2]|uniref:hypothetical protein n=1 Tax=Ochrobactrum sp. BTU2 TaxID=2856166 RepID=UPI00211A7A9E|nr:hypothetical protein [Ochrobactrum sp. BTU2]MCQ9144558.1 hypothetical protein [Ochrobactrum sp. BTU2]